ncbi:cytosine deaminase [Halobellus limi]|uniref:Cytosine deaminase n=1 Tax=Halobellus limi TaxID=699433 RepID=A0A1H5X6J9_9EURY|nr:cytosine deaminase [Halobellus limi]QCC46243.1 N-isopropylammelide isopropylaminohydrolase [Halobellus limi]SEG07075.1 cytosine deaminase [Halobellus limi]
MAEYIVTNGRTVAGDSVDVEVRAGAIDRLVPAGDGDPDAFPADRRYDADGRLVTPPLVEPHVHLDATGTAGDPSWNDSGTLAEGIEVWAEYKGDITVEDILERATRTVEWYASHGVTRIRTHADTTEPSLTTVEALVELKSRVSDLVDLQVVAFPQDGILTDESHEDLLEDAVEMGVDLVGGIPHNEYTREDGVQSVGIACDLAERHGLPLDLHIDETDDPNSRFTEVLASEAIKRGIGDRVTASHTTATHSYNNAYADKLISMLAESGVSVVTNPPDNSVLQGAYDDYPRRRGHTRIDELREAGVTVGIGHDSVLDPWYHYGVADPLDAAFILAHYAHMAGRADVEVLWEMLTDANAEVFDADGYGLSEGDEGSLVVYDAPDGFNALRTQAPRTLVLREGDPIARTEPSTTTVHRSDGAVDVDYKR